MGHWLLVAMMGCTTEPSGTAPPAPAGGGPSGEPAGRVVATVGDGFVTEADFAAAASRVQPAGAEISPEERKEVLDKLVTEEILFQQATAKGLYRDPKVRKIMVNLLLREEVYDDVRTSDISVEELEAFYNEHKDEFTVPEKIQIKRIFLKFGGESGRTEEDALALGKELSGKIKKDPTAFKDLAEQHSDDPYKRRGGDLGYVARDGKPGIPPEVIEKAFTLNVNQLSEPFVAGDGVNLVLVAAKRQAVERTFEQMKGSVLRRLKNERFQELTETYIAEAKGKYTVNVDDAVLSSVKVESRPMAPSGVDPGSLLPGVGPRPDRAGIATPGEEGLEEIDEALEKIE
jgi:peptidyl-prolyl cis-trans isomerase C